MTETRDAIMERLKNELPERYDVSVGTYTYDIEAAHAVEFENAYDIIENKEKQFNVATATGTYLDAIVSEVGITRKEASIAESDNDVVITGSPGAIVRAGDKVAAGNIIFSITENAEIGRDGIVRVKVICDMPGSQGNVPAGAINRFPITLPNIISVRNEKALSGGADKENDSELRARFTEYVSHPITPGNKWYYVSLAKSVSGVGDAKCQPLWNGNGTAKVIIVGTDMQPANDALISKVQSHIDENRNIGADITVSTATEKIINISCKLTREADITELIRENLKKYFVSVSFKGSYVSYAQIGHCILDTEGATDYSNLTINGGRDNIPVAETEIAVLGGVELDGN